jgi:hypothetical protein
MVFALIEGIAAGAMLTMIAETMLPEAFHKGGGIVGISTLAGFLAAVLFNTSGRETLINSASSGGQDAQPFSVASSD